MPQCAIQTVSQKLQVGLQQNSSNIDSGILPFMVTPLGATSVKARQEEVDAAMLDYGVLFKGTNRLSLADSRVI